MEDLVVLVAFGLFASENEISKVYHRVEAPLPTNKSE